MKKGKRKKQITSMLREKLKKKLWKKKKNSQEERFIRKLNQKQSKMNQKLKWKK